MKPMASFQSFTLFFIFILILLQYLFFLQNNSLKEWSYKKAVTIQTYESYHPVHAPLNIISEFFLLRCWNKEKTGEERRIHANRVKKVWQ